MEAILKKHRLNSLLAFIFILILSLQLYAQPQSVENAECQNFFCCLENGNLSSIKACLDKNPDYLSRVNCWGLTPLMVAAEAGQYRLVSYLLKMGADIEAENRWGYRAIHLAAQSGDLKTVKLLVEYGANIECKNQVGNTPLNYAIQSENYDLVQYLLKKEANGTYYQ